MPRIRWAPRPAAPAPLSPKFFELRDLFRARGIDLFFHHDRRQFEAINGERVLQTFATLAQAEGYLQIAPHTTRVHHTRRATPQHTR